MSTSCWLFNNNGSGGGGGDDDITKEIKQMPVIKIQTVSAAENVMDFVTKPVDASVMIAETCNGKDPYLYSDMLPYNEESIITVINEYGETTISFATADVKIRGNYTSASLKKPLKIEFSEKKSMLGLHDGKEFKKWVLLADWKDPSYLRDPIGFYASKLLGGKYYASDSTLVEVYINNEYWGVYVLAEQQESKRAGITNAKKDDGITNTGYLFEMDFYGCYNYRYVEELGLGNTISDNHGNTYEIDEDYFWAGFDGNGDWYSFKSKCDSDKLNFLRNYMNSIVEICMKAIYWGEYYTFNSDYSGIVKDTSSKSAEDCLSKVIDLDSLVNTYILAEIVCDQDLNYSSFYMSVDFGEGGNKKLTFQAPWDFDSTMGHIKGEWCGDLTKTGISHLYANHYDDDQANIGKGNFWTRTFMDATWFQQKVSKKWQTVKSQNLLGKFTEKIDSVTNSKINQAAFKRDAERWSQNDADWWRDSSMIEKVENPGVSVRIMTQKESSDILKEWLTYRFGNLDVHFDLNNPASDLYNK